MTLKELQLTNTNFNNDSDMIYRIKQLNQQTLPLIQNLIEFKNDTLNKVLTCKLFTANYPLLIAHIMNEDKMYHHLLSQIEQGETPISEYNEQLFWNNIMKEHAEFIRGLLDPTEKELIKTADQFVDEYEEILRNHIANNLKQMNLNETIQFKKFKKAGFLFIQASLHFILTTL